MKAGYKYISVFTSFIFLVMACDSCILPSQSKPRIAEDSTKAEELAKADKLIAETLAWADSLEKKRRVNENWSAHCTTDQVTMSKRCFASTFGQRMGIDGKPYGSKNIPFQIYFLNKDGPYIMVGSHTYPGRTPMVRVDENEPVQVHDDAGVSARRSNPSLVEELRSGKVARARYHVWPKGSQEMYVDITGFEEAWQRLNQLRSQ